MAETIEERITQVVKDDSLKYDESQGFAIIKKGNATMATEHDTQLGIYMRQLLEMREIGFQSDQKVAIIGAGTCVLPRILESLFDSLDIFELEQALIDWASGKYNAPQSWVFTQGDYEQTLAAKPDNHYDFIFYDLDVPANDQLLISKIKLGGKIWS